MIRKIAIIGLGYVGLPLAVEFGKKLTTMGLDLCKEKIEAYKNQIDPAGEILNADFKAAVHLSYHNDPGILAKADFIIVAVPTPVDQAHQPDLSLLIKSSETIGQYIKPGTIVVYESTVYPGATEELCIPVIEQHSGLRWKKDFFVGYSPERINPGDKEHTLTKIVKVVAGDTPETLAAVAELYGRIITAGIYQASNIKVAEAAKAIENTQRDLNIALMNELAIIFDRVGIDTLEVLEAAGTKWNFLPFRPGLVGGHCIGVDPYYLTHKAEMLGYHPEVILAGRRINDGMASYIAQKAIKMIAQAGVPIKGSKIIILGLSFKENCSDLRNSKVVDLFRELRNFGCDIYVHDPLVKAEEAVQEYGIHLCDWEELPSDVDAIVAAVPHALYTRSTVEKLLAQLKPGAAFIDVKSCYDADAIRSAGIKLWRL